MICSTIRRIIKPPLSKRSIMVDRTQLETVLDFWTNELDFKAKFAKNEAVDTDIRNRFLPLHQDIMRGAYDRFMDDAHMSLAAVIVLDQFSRNMFRDTPEAFASDPKALQLAKMAIEKDYQSTVGDNAMWLYMPFMHSENLDDQITSCDFFSRSPVGPEYAIKHKVLIEKYGRFPHRNAILGRSSTAEEEEYLKQPNAGF